jgi:hypothetical protein
VVHHPSLAKLMDDSLRFERGVDVVEIGLALHPDASFASLRVPSFQGEASGA